MACYDSIQLPWLPLRVPCGKCIGCRADQARDWSIRIMHEAQIRKNAWFVTLTYKDEEIPTNDSLDPTHLRKFIKALRRDHEQKISYYACGEYGENTKRPHYHAVLFGPDFLDKHPHYNRGNAQVWRSPYLESRWKNGNSEFSVVNYASASYTAGYVRKKLTAKQAPNQNLRVYEHTGEIVEVEPEFSRMSLKPAIGKNWIKKYWEETYNHDRVIVEGKEYKPPRYYDKWMSDNHPEVLIKVKIARDEKAKYRSNREVTAAEKIHQARSALFEKRNQL